MFKVKIEIFLILIGILIINGIIIPVTGEEAPNIEWQRCFGGTQSDTCLKVLTSPDNGVIILFQSYSGDGDFNGNGIMKVSSTGIIQWKRFGDIRDIYQDDVGSVFLCGSNQSDLWLEKLDVNGETQWSKYYDGGGGVNDFGQKIKPTLDGGFIISGTTGRR